MLLSAHMLQAVTDVNNWQVTQTLRFTEGDVPAIYFQLVDLEKDTDQFSYRPTGKRFVPATGATLSVTISTIDTATTFTKTASIAFTGDNSIWKIQLLTTDPVLKGTFSIKLALTQSGVITYGIVPNALGIVSQTSAFC